MNYQLETRNKTEDACIQIQDPKVQNKIECYCCKNSNVSIFRIINAKSICGKCIGEIARLRTRYDLSSSSKLFQTQSSRYYSKIIMNPTSQFDFLFQECSICGEERMLIKVCGNNHFICEYCLFEFIQQNFETSTKCFQSECSGNINLQIVFLYLEKDQLSKWLPVTEQIHCIGTHCSAIWTVWPTYISGNIKQLSLNKCQCQLCGIIFCIKCRTIHKNYECDNDVILNNYLKDNLCFRCEVCNSLTQPGFCFFNDKIHKFSDWKTNLYTCYVCKKQFCYDCKKESKIMLFSNSQCENCKITFRRWKKQNKLKIPKIGQIIQIFFSLIIVIMFAIYSMIFYQIPQVFDMFFQKMDPICQTQNPVKIILLIINLPLILVLMLIVYVVTLIPLAIYNSYTVFIVRGRKKKNEIDIDL